MTDGGSQSPVALPSPPRAAASAAAPEPAAEAASQPTASQMALAKAAIDRASGSGGSLEQLEVVEKWLALGEYARLEEYTAGGPIA